MNIRSPDHRTTCSRCGAVLPVTVLGGLCLRCTAGSYLFDADDGRIVAEGIASSDLESSARKLSVGERIGSGGMGEVFAAADAEIGRTVAVKRLAADRQDNAAAKSRFLSEARITGRLEHPGVVPVYEMGVDSHGRPFYVMRRVNGVTLAQILSKLKNRDAATVREYPLAALLTVFQKACDAVAYAHSRKILHRDLKPENVMVGEFGEVAVMDWGLAKVLSESAPSDRDEAEGSQTLLEGAVSHRTLDNVVLGSPGFMAPEQADGRANESDERTDVFALGGILYAILTFHPPVVGQSSRSVIDRTKAGIIRPLSDFNASLSTDDELNARDRLPHCPEGNVPASLSAVVMKALALSPNERYATVKDLQADVSAYQNGFPTTVDRAGLLTHLRLLVKRRRTEFMLAAGAFTIVVVMATAFLWRVTATLKELRSTAPSFAAEARSLIEEGSLTNALEKIRYAQRLAPREAEYRVCEGNILQALFRFDEAREAYNAGMRIRPNHKLAQQNQALCEELVESESLGSSRQQMLDRLRVALVEQGRVAEAVIVARQILSADRSYLEKWRQHLFRAGFPGSLTLGDSGGLELDANRTGATHLDALTGLPLTRLDISYTRVSDLSPIRGMPLMWLNIQGSDVSDLGPVAGLPLQELNISDTKVVDLSPLKGMKLLYLIGQRLAIRDLTPLKGMPLRYLNLYNCRELSDIRPLAGMMLHHIDLYYSRVTDLSPLRGMPLGNLNITATPVANIEPLKELPLVHLEMESTLVRDITPLKGLALTNLVLRGSPIRDVSPVRGMPLQKLMLDSCSELEDLSPVASCRQLELLTIPPGKKGVEALRGLPRLRKLSYSISNSHTWELTPSAVEFWLAFDAASHGGAGGEVRR